VAWTVVHPALARPAAFDISNPQDHTPDPAWPTTRVKIGQAMLVAKFPLAEKGIAVIERRMKRNQPSSVEKEQFSFTDAFEG